MALAIYITMIADPIMATAESLMCLGRRDSVDLLFHGESSTSPVPPTL